MGISKKLETIYHNGQPDGCILDSDGMVRADCFTIPNNMDGFKTDSLMFKLNLTTIQVN